MGSLLILGLQEFVSTSLANWVTSISLIGMGSVWLVIGVRQLYQYHQVNANWAKCEANILATKTAYYHEPVILEKQPIGYKTPVILYEYVYNQKSYQSTHMAIHPLNLVQTLTLKNILNGQIDDDMSVWWQQAILKDTIEIYVNPDEPNQSIISTPNSLKIPIYIWFYMLFGMSIFVYTLRLLI